MTNLLRLLPCLILLVPAATAQTTTRVNVSSTGVVGSLGSSRVTLSADGRYACIESFSPDLVANDTNGTRDIFVHDRQTGQTTRVSVDSAGVQANAQSLNADISADGRFVVFESTATNLVTGDTNGVGDIFCHDRQTGQTTRVSLGAAGQQAVMTCRIPTVSADGRFVAFQTDDNALVPGNTCLSTDVFLRDRQLNTTTWVSVSNTTSQTFTPRGNPRISADGSLVVFDSTALDLVQNDNNGWSDVFAWSRLTGAIEIVSFSTGGAQGNHLSLEPSVSADGRFVAFTSYATNFGGGSGPGNGNSPDIFVRDRLTGQTSCVSIASSGAGATDLSDSPSISADGRSVAFRSAASNLVAGDTNGVGDCFLHDRQNATTIRVSVSPAGLQARIQSVNPVVAGDGRYVAFGSTATNLVLPPFQGWGHSLVRDLQATAVATGYGSSCAGTSPIPAQAEGMGQPFVGNASFAVGVCNAFPSAFGVLALSPASASTPVGPCIVALGSSVTMVGGSFTDIFGFTSAAVPIPANPGLAGLTLFGQYLVFDPNGQFLGFAQLSQGLAITIN
jgi:Tol biopolymer transport system component